MSVHGAAEPATDGAVNIDYEEFFEKDSDRTQI